MPPTLERNHALPVTWSDLASSPTEGTDEVFAKLDEATALYARYVDLSGIYTVPTDTDVELAEGGDAPVGLVIRPQPTGVSIPKQT